MVGLNGYFITVWVMETSRYYHQFWNSHNYDQNQVFLLTGIALTLVEIVLMFTFCCVVGSFTHKVGRVFSFAGSVGRSRVSRFSVGCVSSFACLSEACRVLVLFPTCFILFCSLFVLIMFYSLLVLLYTCFILCFIIALFYSLPVLLSVLFSACFSLYLLYSLPVSFSTCTCLLPLLHRVFSFFSLVSI